MGSDLCFHWQPWSWHCPISFLLNVEGKAAQRALHYHSHRWPVSLQLQHGSTTVCLGAQRLLRKDALTSAPPQLHVHRSSAENQMFTHWLHWGWVSSLSRARSAPGPSHTCGVWLAHMWHLHMTYLLMESGLTEAQLCRIKLCSQVSGLKSWKWKCHISRVVSWLTSWEI